MLAPTIAPDLKGVVPGAVPVVTAPFALVQRFCGEVVEIGGILTASGPGGAGKTYAVSYWSDRASVPVIRLHLGDRIRGNELLRTILAKLGEPTDGNGAILLERVRAALADRRLVIFVDEANLLNREALRQLRYLHDQRDARFALVFTGVDFDEAFAGVPEFASRVARRVTFGPLTGAALLTTLAANHGVFAATETGVLQAIDAQYAKGLWRHWENVLAIALAAGATAETGISMAVARGSLGAIVGGAPARKRGRR